MEIKDLAGRNLVIHCGTAEEAIEFLKKCMDAGFKDELGYSLESMVLPISVWGYNEDTGYIVSNSGQLSKVCVYDHHIWKSDDDWWYEIYKVVNYSDLARYSKKEYRHDHKIINMPPVFKLEGHSGCYHANIHRPIATYRNADGEEYADYLEEVIRIRFIDLLFKPVGTRWAVEDCKRLPHSCERWEVVIEKVFEDENGIRVEYRTTRKGKANKTYWIVKSGPAEGKKVVIE